MTFQKQVQALIDASWYEDANEEARNAFLHGADLHGYVLGDDLPMMWACEMCGTRRELGSLAVAADGPLVGQPLCTGKPSHRGSSETNCPAYGFDLIHPALPDETTL